MNNIRTFTLSKNSKRAVLKDLSALLGSRNEIIFAYAHGSFLESGPFRDLDIAVCLHTSSMPASSFHYEDRLAQQIAARLNLAFPVDLRLVNGAPVAFQYRVFRGSLLVDNDPEFRVKQITHVVARYLDILPVLKHHAREAFSNERG